MNEFIDNNSSFKPIGNPMKSNKKKKFENKWEEEE